MHRHLLSIVSCAVVAGLVGCSSDPAPRPLAAEQFTRPTDQGGALPPGPAPKPAPKTGTSAVDQERAAEDYSVVAQHVRAPKPIPDAPATQPTTTPAAALLVPGQFLTVGGVIAQVNRTPIYADAVLREIAPALAGRAKDLDQAKFKVAAQQEIARQVDDMIRAEVEYAAADRNTNQEDKKLAERMTEVWRDSEITKHKGSVEEARAAYRALGGSFDDAAKERYRIELVRLYYRKKLMPRVQISAGDMRAYYEKNKDAMFTERASATFRLIKVTTADTGSNAAAKAKIQELADRARKGEDFETLAENNKDPNLLRAKGLVGPIDKGAYVLEAVENAIWKLNPGEVTPVVAVGDDYYLARLESKKTGRVMAFEEDVVQRKIGDALRGEQFQKMRKDMDTQLRKESVVSKNPDMFNATLDMAMQNYARWRG